MIILRPKPIKKNCDIIEIVVPGSKSESIRALILAAIFNGDILIENCARCDEVESLISALSILGIYCERRGRDIYVEHCDLTSTDRPIKFDMGENDTAAIMLIALLVHRSSESIVHAGPRLSSQDLSPFCNALRELGVNIEGSSFPLKISSSSDIGGKIAFTEDHSSMFTSSVMLMSILAKNNVTIHLNCTKEISKYIVTTFRMASDLGCDIIYDDNYQAYKIGAAHEVVKVKKIPVNSDLVVAMFLTATSLISGREVRIPNWKKDNTQPEKRFFDNIDVIGGMGRDTEKDFWIGCRRDVGKITDVSVYWSPYAPVIMTSLATFTDQIVSVNNVLGKDKKGNCYINVLPKEFRKMGFEVRSKNSTMVVEKSTVEKKIIYSGSDHRIIMAMPLLAMHGIEVFVKKPHIVDKVCMNYFQYYEDLGLLDIL